MGIDRRADHSLVRSLTRWFPVLVAAWLTIGIARAAEQEHYALLVGVSHYDNLPASYQLKGPPNDVDIVAQVLAQIGVPRANIRILADLANASERPTRAAILGELDRLADLVRTGDFVYLHFSGHGSRQPAAAGLAGTAASAGYQDVFLPEDVGRWDGQIGAVAGAITGHEFGAAIRKIRSRGAFVWAVFDACHSGAMVRALPATDEEERERQVDPVDLGVPAQTGAIGAEAGSGANSALDRPQEPDPGAGGFVGFFAAQSHEKTVEMRLPAGARDRKVQGLFTFTLMQALAANPQATYRALGEAVLQTYVSLNRRSPTPDFNGSEIDAAVFGTGSKQSLRQWPLLSNAGHLEIEAGALHRLTKSSILAVLTDPAAGNERSIGYAEITELDVMRSEMRPVPFNGIPAFDPEAIPRNAIARLIRPGLDTGIRLALPPQPADSSEGMTSEIYRILVDLAAHTNPWSGGPVPTWVAAGNVADVRLMIEAPSLNHATVWLLDSSGEIVPSGPAQTARIRLDKSAGDLRSQLVNAIRSAVKALGLLRTFREIETIQGEQLVKLTVLRQRPGENLPQELELGRIPALNDGDIVTFVVANQSSGAIDVTMLYVDSEFHLSAIYPSPPGAPNRIERGGYHALRVRVSSRTSGLEQLMVIATPARALAARSDFSFLAEDIPVLERSAETERSPVLAMFHDAGFGSPLGRGQSADGPDRVQTLTTVLGIQAAK